MARRLCCAVLISDAIVAQRAPSSQRSPARPIGLSSYTLEDECSTFFQRLIVYTSSGFPTMPGSPSLFGRNGTSRAKRVFGGRESIPRKACFSRPSLRVRIRAHQPFVLNSNHHALAAGLGLSRCARVSAATGLASKWPMPGRLQLCDNWKLRRARFSSSCSVIAAVVLLGSKRPQMSRSGFRLSIPLALRYQRNGQAEPASAHLPPRFSTRATPLPQSRQGQRTARASQFPVVT